MSTLSLTLTSFPFSSLSLRRLTLLSSPHNAFISRSFQTQTQFTPPQPSPSLSPLPNVITILESRGLVETLTSNTLRTTCTQTPLKLYCGFDPTAPSLHLGNLLAIIVLSWFRRCGHHSYALLGGATGRVGDPSGKSSERPLLPLHTLDTNILSIHRSLCAILNNDNVGNSVKLVNNYDWWKDVGFLDFLKDVGKYARVGTMMAKESVKKRLESEQGMSFTEFTYQLLQGYDFVHLYRTEGVTVQIGGSDQWGNITAGTDLIRKMIGSEKEKAFGMTFPLLLKSDGSKFGKSEEGAVWLSREYLSPYKFYQYFFSVPDEDVVKFLKMLTFLELEEIEGIEREMKGGGYVPNMAQKRLAEEVTRFVHGEDGLREAVKATEALRPGAETKLDWETIEGIAKDVPCCEMGKGKVVGVLVIDVAVLSGLMESKAAAKRMLKQGGLYLNNVRVDAEGKKVEEEDVVDGKVLLLSAGKKNKMVVRLS